MFKLLAFVALIFVLSGCGGATTPCNDADPVGICAGSHSHVYGSG
jgi:hypothetical protein